MGTEYFPRKRATILTFTPPAHLDAASRIDLAPMLLKRPTAVSSTRSDTVCSPWRCVNLVPSPMRKPCDV